MKMQKIVTGKALVLRTHIKLGYRDSIQGCKGLFVTTELGPTGQTRIRATCMDMRGKWHKTSVEFSNSYQGLVQNCNGNLTAGGCG
jgi:hypothetical protein